jgi:hypothetical protein
MTVAITYRDSVDKERLQRLIGENCKRARLWHGMTRFEAMHLIFGYKDEKQLNRIVELEKGSKPISTHTLYKVSLAYKCSIDFLFGISNEIEPNLAASHNGLILETMRSTALEVADVISHSMSKTMQNLPRFQGAMLHMAAKNLVKEILMHTNDLAFSGVYGDLIEGAHELQTHVIAFETMMAKYQRAIELNMVEHVEGYEKMNLSITRDQLNKPVPAQLEQI